MAATVTGLTTSREARENEVESLPDLFSRLGDDAIQLLNSQLALFKVEIKEEASAYARVATMIAFGAVIAAVGFALLNVAVAFGVSTFFAGTNLSQPAAYALGFVITGAFYLVVGSILLMTIKSRLSKQRLVPRRSVEELRKDKEWLTKEL